MRQPGCVWWRNDRSGWYAKVTIDGERRTKGRFTTKARAQMWVAKQLENAEIAEILDIPALKEDITFKEMVRKWKPHVVSRLSPTTYRRYVSISDKILMPVFGDMKLHRINRRHIEDFLVKVHEKGKKGATVNNYLTVFSTIMTHAVDLQYARENPVKQVKRAKVTLIPPRYLTPEEEGRLLAALPAWLRPAVLVSLDAGLRAGEIARLTRRDIDLGRGTIRILTSKNNEPRMVGITKRLATTLERHLKTVPRDQREVFKTPTGGSFANQGYRAYFDKAVERADIAPFRFHDCRHACGVRLAEAGATPAEIAAYLGHKTLDMTLRYIRHAPRDSGVSLARLLDEARENGQPSWRNAK